MANKDRRGLAWHIDCDERLQVTIAVIDNRLLLFSDDKTADPHWRIGTYMDATEAARRAVDMTASYEKLRHGKVGDYAEVVVPGLAWQTTIANEGEVSPEVSASIEAALLSPVVSPEE